MNRRKLNERTFKALPETLIPTIEANREKHLKEYREASYIYEQKKAVLDGFLKDFEQRLKEEAADLADRLGTEVKPNVGDALYFNLPKPQSHVEHYDTVLTMLRHADPGEPWEVSGEEARAWLEDDWEWSRQFASTVSQYTSRG